MKCIFKFLSYCSFTLLIALNGVSASENISEGVKTSICNYCNNEGLHTFRTITLPCGCKNHLNCLLELASGKLRYEEKYITPKFDCLNPNCPRKYDFKTGKEFWKYVWAARTEDTKDINIKDINIKDIIANFYFPPCGHFTLPYVKRKYLTWLDNMKYSIPEYPCAICDAKNNLINQEMK